MTDAEARPTPEETKRLLDLDWALYGTNYITRRADGTLERIDPTTIRVIVEAEPRCTCYTYHEPMSGCPWNDTD